MILYPTFKLKNYVTDRMSFYVANEHREFLKVDTNISLSRSHLVEKMENKSKDRDYLDDDAFDEDRLLMHFSENLSTEDTFLLTRVTEEERYSALFIKSSYMVLYEIVELFCNKTFKTLPSNLLLSRLEFVLIQLSKFIFGYETESLYMLEQTKCEPLIQRQRFLKDFGILDYLMDIIYLPFKNEYYKIEEITTSMYFTRVLKTCYSTLTLGI